MIEYAEKTFKTIINMFKYPMENKNIMRRERKKKRYLNRAK